MNIQVDLLIEENKRLNELVSFTNHVNLFLFSVCKKRKMIGVLLSVVGGGENGRTNNNAEHTREFF